MSHVARPLPSAGFALLLATLATAVSGCGDSGDTAATVPEPAPADTTAVAPKGVSADALRAIDGDTIDVRIGGKRQRVRLLGIDAPESSTMRTGSAECGGQDASRAMRALVADSPVVTVATDPTQDEQDQYGRLLAYVSAQETGELTWQEIMLRVGYARVYEQRSRPVKLDAKFRAAAAYAKANGNGVWESCGGNFRQPE